MSHKEWSPKENQKTNKNTRGKNWGRKKELRNGENLDFDYRSSEEKLKRKSKDNTAVEWSESLPFSVWVKRESLEGNDRWGGWFHDEQRGQKC